MIPVRGSLGKAKAGREIGLRRRRSSAPRHRIGNPRPLRV